MNEGSIETVYVDAQTLRQRFNSLDYVGAVTRGELVAVIKTDRVLQSGTPFPVGTRAQIVYYMRGQTRMAVVHQYMLPDGSVGASGRPDPKMVRDGLTIFKTRR